MFKVQTLAKAMSLAISMLFSLAAQAGVLDAPACPRDTSAAAVGMPSTERIYAWNEALTKFGYRRTGTLASQQAAAYMKCQFEALGLQDVHFEGADSWKWEATKSSLSVNNQPIDSFPSAFSFITADKPSVFSTPPGGLNADIVDVGDGGPISVALTNVKGKIVVFDLKFLVSTADFLPLLTYLYDPGLTILEPASFLGNPYQTNISPVINRLVKAGAAGFVGVLSDYFDSNKYYNEYYNSLQMTVPGFWVTKKEGDRIRTLMRTGGGRPNASIVMEGRRDIATARAVVGVLPGQSLDTILVTSHHDSVWNGGVEDGSGAASVLAQAQYFASKPLAERQKTMLFTTMDSHFTGYQVHRAFGEKYILKQTPANAPAGYVPPPYNIVADATIEHIAKQGYVKDGKLVVTDQPEVSGIIDNLSDGLRDTLKKSIARNDLRRTAMISSTLLCPTVGIPTDAFACVAGVPTASLIAGPAYLYDQADTIDKVAKDRLVPVAKVFAELIEAIDKTPAAKIKR